MKRTLWFLYWCSLPPLWWWWGTTMDANPRPGVLLAVVLFMAPGVVGFPAFVRVLQWRNRRENEAEELRIRLKKGGL